MADVPPAFTPLSPEFLERFRSRAGANGRLRFDEFMELALYDPDVGYYRKKQRRVGYGGGTDFYTASTSGALFGELICAAAAKLLNGQDLSTFTFVELGAEPERTVLDGVQHPFGKAETVRVGQPLKLKGRLVVFSNELFDAQPFRRFARQSGMWREKAVVLEQELLAEVLTDPEDRTILTTLPAEAPDGYQIDLPAAAEALTRQIASQPWTGLFVALDYGKWWRELVEATPAGTGRAYYRHTQSNDLLARPGEQDLTCHVCWDWLAGALSAHGFSDVKVESQEAFFIHHAGNFIAETTAAEAARFSQRKLSLMQLLHPAHLGQKFQTLHGLRV